MSYMEIQLSRGKVALVDANDFDYLSQWSWCVQPKKTGKEYAIRKDYSIGKTVRMHQVIMNPDENMQVDHINGNGLDNRRSNLRICTNSQNQANRTNNHPKNKSGYKGVCWHKRDKVWVARIGYKSKSLHIGNFGTKDEAALAYNQVAKVIHGEFANLNPVKELA